jgi:hypothetical protein
MLQSAMDFARRAAASPDRIRSIPINQAELDLLLEATRTRGGEIKARIGGGRLGDADRARFRALEVLEYTGALQSLPDKGSYAVWRLTPATQQLLSMLTRTS